MNSRASLLLLIGLAALAPPATARADSNASGLLAVLTGPPIAVGAITLAIGLGLPISDGRQPHPAWTVFGFLGSAGMLAWGGTLAAVYAEGSSGFGDAELAFGVGTMLLGGGVLALTVVGLTLPRDAPPVARFVPVLEIDASGTTTVGLAFAL